MGAATTTSSSGFRRTGWVSPVPPAAGHRAVRDESPWVMARRRTESGLPLRSVRIGGARRERERRDGAGEETERVLADETSVGGEESHRLLAGIGVDHGAERDQRGLRLGRT